MKKKITLVFVVILILFNFIYRISYADENNETADSDTNKNSYEMQNIEGLGIQTPKSEGILKEITDGQGKILDYKKTKNIKDSVHNLKTTNYIMANVGTNFALYAVGNMFPKVLDALGEKDFDVFTVFDLVTGKYEFFNMNFYKSEQLDDSIDDGKVDEFGTSVKTTIMEFYYITRSLSLALSIFVLLYIAIRMVISTVDIERIKYRNMLLAWVSSIVLLFFMHFIVIIFSYVSDLMLKIIRDIAMQMEIDNIEHNILESLTNKLAGDTSGFHGIANLITLCIFFYYEIKFFIAYIYRFCEIAFLVTVSPLVTITYSIDKVGDNKAQAFRAWFKELSIKYSIQVVHAIMYCVLIGAAGAIASKMPIVGALFLLSMDRAEKVFKNIFNVNDKNFEKAHVPFLDRHKHGPHK